MVSDPLVLAFDTSAAHCAAALLCGDRIVTARHEEMARGQAERLAPLVEEVLAEAGAAGGDLAAIGVGTGPGNFTGVRISVAFARGLSLSLGIPAIGVDGLSALAFGAPGPVLASLDARREMVYLARFGAAPLAPFLCPLNTLPEGLALPGLTCIGDGADLLAERLDARAAAPAFPLAEAIARIAAALRFDPGIARPAPLYLRGADAAPPADPPPVLLP